MAVAQWTNRFRDFTEMPEEESVGKERGGGGGGGGGTAAFSSANSAGEILRKKRKGRAKRGEKRGV